MVTLVKVSSPIDRKIIPIDLYSATMAFGLFDIQQFCSDYLKPCFKIKEKLDGTLRLKIDENLLGVLITQCNQRVSQDFNFVNE
jgi:hypothetical protein